MNLQYRLKNFFILKLDKTLMVAILAIIVYSLVIMWSASGQSIAFMERKIIQSVLGLIAMIVISAIPPRHYANWSLLCYTSCIGLLVAVKLIGPISNGAQRWLDIGIIRFQPSEIAKLAVPLLVCKLLQDDTYPPNVITILKCLFVIMVPTTLVALQPDLGTAILIASSGLCALYLSGIHWRLIVAAILGIATTIPVLWYCMHDYQRQRVLILLDPSKDPLGAGYHIIQSKIAIGSGGIFGKGWLKGTQSQLDFLPERHTDFIFAVIAEELGLVGSIILILLYSIIILRSYFISLQVQNTFERLLVGTLTFTFFVYVFVNVGMVSGILPVVGIPLPIISYGGSAQLVLMAGFGIIMSIHANPYRKAHIISRV